MKTTLVLLALLASLTSCVGNRAQAELNVVKIEKRSQAAEVDQYVNTAGKVLTWLRGDRDDR